MNLYKSKLGTPPDLPPTLLQCVDAHRLLEQTGARGENVSTARASQVASLVLLYMLKGEIIAIETNTNEVVLIKGTPPTVRSSELGR